MAVLNFPELTRNEGRWLNLWAAFDVTAEYLGTFTLDDLRTKAESESKWINAVQYRRCGQRIDEAALAVTYNGLCKGDTPFNFTGFCVSPVREDAEKRQMEVCQPGEHAFWSIYGFREDAREWQLVHDCQPHEAGEMLALLVDLTGHLVEYRDSERAYANTRLRDLPQLLADRIHDEIPASDHPDAREDDFDNHPLTELREMIVEALDRRA